VRRAGLRTRRGRALMRRARSLPTVLDCLDNADAETRGAQERGEH
jgi:hypothetical protein